MKILRTIALGVLALAPISAVAEDVKVDGYFGWLSVGTAFPIEEGRLFWVGQFSGVVTDNGAGSLLDNAAVQCPGSLDINTKDGTAEGAGYCIFTISTGDKVFGRWDCAGGAPMSGSPCNGNLQFTSGTGKLANASGGNKFEANTVAFHPDGSGSGYTLTHFDFTTAE